MHYSSYRSAMKALNIALEAEGNDGGADILASGAEQRAFPQNGNGNVDQNNAGGNDNNGAANDNNQEKESGGLTGHDAGSNPDQATDNQDNGTNNLTDDNNSDNTSEDDEDNGDDYENDNTQDVNEDDERIKQNTIQRMIHLHEIVSSNLEKLSYLDHEIKNINISLYSKVQNKFVALKENLFKLITEEKYLSKDCADYVKYYVTAREMYNLCIEMTKVFFDDYEKYRKNEEKNKKK